MHSPAQPGLDDAPTALREPLRPKHWLSREVKVLSAVNFVSAVGFGIQSPTIPVFALQLGVGSAMVGMIIAAFAFGRMIANLPGGRLVDQFGARYLVASGLCLLALCSILAGMSGSGWHLILFRGLCGVGSALYSVAAMSLLIRTTSSTHCARVVGLYMGAFYVGATAGPAIGATMSGLSPRVPFFLYGAGVAACACYVYVALKSSTLVAAPKPAARAPSAGLRNAFRLEAFRAAFFCNFGVGWASYGVRVSILPLFLMHVIHADPSWIGIALALGALLQAAMLPVAGSIADLVGRKPALVAGQAALLLAYLLVVFSPSLWAYLTCFGVMSVGTALCVTSGAALTGDLSKDRPGGGALVGAYQTAADIGTMAGAVLTGWLAQELSYTAAFYITICVVAVGLISACLMSKNGSDD